jgi:phenylalanyl-tRNA synthetase alpha chain
MSENDLTPSNLEALIQRLSASIAASGSLPALTYTANSAIGRNSELTQILRSLRNLDAHQKISIASIANEGKRKLEREIEERRESLTSDVIVAELKSAEDRPTDPTQPLLPPRARGHEHPVKSVMRELEELFESMGFTVVDGPEVETDFFNFEALNIPPHHPARDAQDTFYVEGGNVLRTHTSGMQIRAMQKYGAPLRVVAPGRVFRNETQDAGHEHTFHQIEGLLVDEGISVGHLKGVLDAMLFHLFGEQVPTRLRPHYFPFVEPGLELDFQCRICAGKGCATCKQTGWIELCGCGMVHPKVLAAGNVDRLRLRHGDRPPHDDAPRHPRHPLDHVGRPALPAAVLRSPFR